MDIIEMKDKRLQAEYTSDSADTIMLTVPYEKGWSVKVNGNKVPCKKIADVFTGIDLQEGENRIEMNFHLPGKTLGIGITLCAFAVFSALQIVERRKTAKGKVVKTE